MKNKKLNICILLDSPHNPDMPVMAITEIYNIHGKYLPSFGHKITWIVPSRERIREVQEESFDKVKVYNIPYSEYSSLLMRIFNKLLFSFRQAKFVTKTFKKENYDIIQVRQDIFCGILGIYIKTKYKIPFVFHYSFPLIESPEDSTKVRILKKTMNLLSVWVMRNADLVFTTSSKWMGRHLIQKGITESKIMTTSNCADVDLFSPLKDGKEIRERYNLENALVIIYLGALDKHRQLDILLRAFSRVRAHKDNVKLLIVGEGDGRANLEKLVSELKIQNDVIFTGQVSHFDVPYFIAAADSGVSPVPPLPTYKIGSPTKMFEYMAMGKAVIANEEILDHKETIEQSGGGILVKFDERAFADAILELLNNSERTEEMGRRGREWVVKNQNYETLAREVEKKYFELLKR